MIGLLPGPKPVMRTRRKPLYRTLLSASLAGACAAPAPSDGGAPPLTVSIAANPTTATRGQSSQLAWSSSGATSCAASRGWSGVQATAGTVDVWPTATTTYVLTCTGDGGSGTDSAAVTVAAAPYVYPLEVGSTGRHLVDQTGRPFLLVGDAAWSLIAQPPGDDAEAYLANRAQLGFNAVIVELIEHRFADNAPANYYGEAPFTGTVFTTPNEAYFAHADRVIQAAAEQGITVLLNPAYVGYDCDSDGWCAEMKAASVNDMTAWGRFLGSRYKDVDNIIWLIGGDTDPTPVKDKLEAVVGGIRQFDTRHLFTTHNQNPSLAIDPWPGESWQTLNSYYTYGTASYVDALRAYRVTPPMPFYFLEAIYENSGVTRQQLRAQHYWSVLTGGIGHVYGNCPLWHFGSSAGSIFCAGTDWKGQLNSPGALDMYRFQKLFSSRHWDKLVPDEAHEAVTGGMGTFGTDGYVVAAYTSDGSSIIAYLPTSRQVTVSGRRLVGDTMTAWWYNPATGVPSSIGTFSTGGFHTFTPPSSGDWVLVADSPTFGFLPPGT